MKELKNKNYVLCIETTSPMCSVALFCDGNLIDEINYNFGLNHSVTLFTAVNDILISNKIEANLLSKIKVSSGPGSFTGIRIGVACAIGLATQNSIPIEYVDTLDVLTEKCDPKFQFIITMIDAKNERIYFSFYDKKHIKLIKDSVVSINNLIFLLNKYFNIKNVSILFVGPCVDIYKDILNKNLKIKYKLSNINTNLKANLMYNIKGSVSSAPYINYILASKAERELNGKY